MSENENTKTASERLEGLEKMQGAIIQAIQPMELMAKDLMDMKAALKLLNNKLDSVVKALNDQKPLTEETINENMVENNMSELKSKVDQMVFNGMLVSSDAVGAESFLVLSEADGSGKVTNPRLQFLLSNIQNEAIREKLNGAKVGDTIVIDDKGNTVTVLESYNVVIPEAPAATPAADAAPAAETAASDSASSDAPAETQAATESPAAAS